MHRGAHRQAQYTINALHAFSSTLYLVIISISLSTFFLIQSRLHPHLPTADNKLSCLIITITETYIQIIELNEQL